MKVNLNTYRTDKYYPRVVKAIAKILSKSDVVAPVEVLIELGNLIQRYLLGELSFQGQRRERLKEIFSHDRILTDNKADKIFQEYLEAYKMNWKLFPDVMSCLEQLSEIRLGIISNGDSSQQMQKLIATGIRERFSVFAISEDIGISKPDPKIFLKA